MTGGDGEALLGVVHPPVDVPTSEQGSPAMSVTINCPDCRAPVVITYTAIANEVGRIALRPTGDHTCPGESE